ncbi:MAG: hypothetical protein DRR19_01230 [Candidatus Parabeggiatoa sp. nov. 1]|nr:MAG: hypothetical protein DRR19_01230 [Gammaproteobacteria bacterium]
MAGEKHQKMGGKAFFHFSAILDYRCQPVGLNESKTMFLQIICSFFLKTDENKPVEKVFKLLIIIYFLSVFNEG